MLLMLAAFVTGTALGFAVAAQIGPIWLLCARTTLRVGAGAGAGSLAWHAVLVAGGAGLGVRALRNA